MAIKIGRAVSLTGKIFKVTASSTKVLKKIKKSKEAAKVSQKGFSEINAKIKKYIEAGYTYFQKNINRNKEVLLKEQRELEKTLAEMQKWDNPAAGKQFESLEKILEESMKKTPRPNPEKIIEWAKELELTKFRYDPLKGIGKNNPFT